MVDASSSTTVSQYSDASMIGWWDPICAVVRHDVGVSAQASPRRDDQAEFLPVEGQLPDEAFTAGCVQQCLDVDERLRQLDECRATW